MRAHPIVAGRTGLEARKLDATQLDTALVDAYARTETILADIGRGRSAVATGCRVPMLATINPPLWERGHLAWFAEFWTLRDPRPAVADDGPWRAARPSLLRDADRWFDSAAVAHDTRWDLDLPSHDAIGRYARDVLERTRERLASAVGDDALYPFRLALFHEDMHGEALTGLQQALDYGAPSTTDATLHAVDDGPSLRVPATSFVQGSPDGDGFTFDNERGATTTALATFSIDRACVSNRAYRDFVDAGGYRDERLWPGPAGRWLRTHALDHPGRWSADADGGWRQRWFGAWQPLPLDAPVCHVSAFEAEAYCRWADRRLPREVEWEAAATGIAAFDWGRAVWEWTADAFLPYPGFRADRYREYSAPWFGSHRAVRGASFATQARLRHARYRNFYTPDRSDLFVGFRTCAVDGPVP